MHSKWFSEPEPAYAELVRRLYGLQTGDQLNRVYRDELCQRALWAQRLDWSGIAIYDADGIRAHAVVQVIRERPLVYVGYVEAVDDPAAAGLLVREVRAAVQRASPGRTIYLPVNLSIWHTYRFKTGGDTCLPFDPPCQPYYGALFAPFFDGQELYSSYRFEVPSSDRLEGVQQPFTVRELSLERLPQELRSIYAMALAVFQDAHSFPSFEEFAAIYGSAAGSINPRYILVAEADGQPIGFIFALPLGQAVYIKTFAVAPSAQNHHVGRLLYEAICRRARADGYQTLYGLLIKNDRLITRLLPPGAQKVAEYTLYRGE